MGDVGNFLFGGSEQEQQQQNSSSNQSSSQNSSQNNAVQASISTSGNQNRSGSGEYNQAYGPISAAMMPTLGNVTAASSMMASLLGLPQPSFSYAQTPFTPGASVLPPAEEVGDINTTIDISGFADIIDALAGSTPTLPPPAPTPAPNPTAPTPLPPVVAPPPPAAPPPAPAPSFAGRLAGGSVFPGKDENMQIKPLAQGGRARPGHPYLVGENEPEVFVPDQPGTVVPGPLGASGYRGHTGRGDWREQVMQRLASRGIAAPPGFGPTPTTPPTTPGTPTTPTTPTAPAVPAPSTGGAAPTANPASGLETFSDSAGMNFILDQGQKAISGASAANGVFNSGATGKALVQYGQNLGQTYLNQYMQHLMNYGQLGLGSASAMSGAGGVSQGQSAGGGKSSSASGSLSSGSSQGSSSASGSSQGTGSGSGNTKNGLLPALAAFVPGAPSS